MEQSPSLRKTAPGFGLLATAAMALGACAGGEPLDPAPQARAPVTPALAASLRSSGYDAPDVGAMRQAGAATPTLVSLAEAPSPRADATAPSAAQPVTVSPYFTPEPAGADEAVIPPPPRAAYAEPARAPLPDLDDIVVVDEREPVRTAQVFEGETRSVMPERRAEPEPAPEPAPVALEPVEAPRARGGATAALHLASYRSAEQAATGWSVLQEEHAEVLAGLSPGRALVDLGERGTFVRLLAGPLSPRDADTACAAIETQGAYCAVVEWSPGRL